MDKIKLIKWTSTAAVQDGSGAGPFYKLDLIHWFGLADYLWLSEAV